MSNFSETLKELMQERGLNSETLVKELGLKSATVNRWTRKEYSVKLANLIMLADYFEYSVEFLTGRTEVYLSFTPNQCPLFMEQLTASLKFTASLHISLTRKRR